MKNITKVFVAGLVAGTAITGLAYAAKGGSTRIKSRFKKEEATDEPESDTSEPESTTKRKIEVESDEPAQDEPIKDEIMQGEYQSATSSSEAEEPAFQSSASRRKSARKTY